MVASMIGYLWTRIAESTRANRELWMAVAAAWAVLWAFGFIGYKVFMPRLDYAVGEIGMVVERIDTLSSDVVGLRGDVSSLRVGQLEGQILVTRQNQCLADNGGGRSFFAGRMQEQLREYRERTGSDYRVPSCEELQ